jgi:predicted RNA binding protein YcfA (HicA-like mRNA interferase family)
MKIPRDISSEQLILALSRIGYKFSRQKGSHIRLTAVINLKEHHITIPNHSQIKIGTLNNLLNDIAIQNEISKENILKILFEK